MSRSLEKNAKWDASYLGILLKQKLGRVPEVPSGTDLHGQTAVITGSTSGLGLDCSRQFLRLRLSRLIMGVRSQSKADKVAAQLRAEYPEADIEVWILDMESQRSVEEFARRCETDLDRLDIAIMNAGGSQPEFRRCGDSGTYETTLQVNYLSNALLGLLLLPAMKAKARRGRPGRLTFVVSDTALWVDPDDLKAPSGKIIDRLNSPEGFERFHWYGLTKALLLMFMTKLAGLVSADDVVINAVNPSAVDDTDISRGAKSSLVGWIVLLIMYIFSTDLPTGTRKYLNTTLVLGKESHGSLCDWIIRPYAPYMYPESGGRLIDQVWDETMTEFPRVASDTLERLKD